MSPRPKSTDPKATLAFQVAPSLVAAVDLAADRRGWTRSEWLRQLVLRGLQGERDPKVRELVAPFVETPVVEVIGRSPRLERREVTMRPKGGK